MLPSRGPSSELESAAQLHSVSPKTQRWGSIKQRLSSTISSRPDSVDEEMWDKNDAAFLQEVAKDSPMGLFTDAFDTLMPLDAGYTRSPSFSSPRPSVDHIYKAANARPSSSNTSGSTSSASTAASSHVEELLSPKGWMKVVKRRGSAAAAAGTLPDLPEQPRSDATFGFSDFYATHEPSEHLSSPTHIGDRSSSKTSPGSSHEDTGDASVYSSRLPPVDQFPRSPSLNGSPSPSMTGIAFRPFWDDRIDNLAGRSPAHVLEVRMGGRASISGRAQSPLPEGTSGTLMEAVEDIHLASSPRSQGTMRKAPLSPEQNQKQYASPQRPPTSDRRRSIAEVLAQTQARERAPTSDMHSGRVTPSAQHDGSAAPSSRKHSRSGSSLVAGLKKLMGKRDRERELRADTNTSSPALDGDGNGFRMPSSSSSSSGADAAGRRIHGDIHFVGRQMGEDHVVGGLNLVGVPFSHSHPTDLSDVSPQKTIRAARAARRSPSVDILRSFAGLGLSSPVAKDSMPAPFPTGAHEADASVPARSRTKSSDGLGRPFRESFSGRARTQSSFGHSALRAQARASVIEHVSFDAAQKVTGSSGPIILHSKESMEELRSQKSAQELAGSNHATPVLSPTRPRRPSSPLSSRFSVDTCSTTGAGVPSGHPVEAARPSAAGFAFQSQAYKAPIRDAASGRLPPSSPSMMSFGLQHTDTSSSEVHLQGHAARAHEAQKLVHGSRRSLSSLGSRPWSNLLGSPILSSSGSTFSGHKRLSTASISRPLSVASSAFSDPNEIGADMQEHTFTARDRFDSNASEPMFHAAAHAVSPRSAQIAVRSRKIGAESRRPMTSGSMTPSSATTTPRFESPLHRSSSVKALHQRQGSSSGSGTTSRYTANAESAGGTSAAISDHRGHRMSSHDALRELRTMSTASFAQRKRPSFGLAIEPAASSAFDSIPSPLLRTRRPSAADAEIEEPILPRRTAFQEDSEAELELLQDRPLPRLPVDHVGRYGRTPLAAAGDAPNFERYYIHSVDEDAPKSGKLSQATKDLAFGSIAGMVSKFFEHPFDLVKVRLQTQPSDQPARYRGAFDCFRQTYVGEGVRGLYRGISMPVFGATLENACLFFTYNRIQSVIRSVNGQQSQSGSSLQADAESPLSFPQLAIAAAGAGAATSLVLTPIELIKCKMQVQMITRQALPVSIAAAAAESSTHAGAGQLNALAAGLDQRRKMSSLRTLPPLDGPLTLLRQTIKADGFRGLWLGQTGTLLRETGGGVAWFLAFESCSRWFMERKKAQWGRDDVSKRDLSSLELVSAGALAGISYNVVLFPADSVKSTMQTEIEMRGPPKPGDAPRAKTGFFQTFKNIYRTRGVKGLYAGCGVTCLRSAPSSALIFLMVNKLEQAADRYGL